MKTQYLIIICLIINLFSSCNNEDEIPHPKIFKGLKLGLDYDSSYHILLTENCSKNLESSDYIRFKSNSDREPSLEFLEANEIRGQYSITEEIFAQPNLFYSDFKGKKIVCSATLLFHSPKYFPSINAQLKGKVGVNEIEGLPAINYNQVNELLEMFDAQYGSRIDNSSMSYYSWKAENMNVVMYVAKYDKSFIFLNFLEPCDKVLTKDAYRVIVTYHYPEYIDKLLEFEKKTESGETVGDKI